LLFIADPPETHEILIDTDELLVRQLKYDLALVRIHSFDMMTTALSILQKLVDDLSSAAINLHLLIGTRGEILLSLLQPSLKLLHRMICQVIQVRKTG
jgi:hypothetical protein